MFCASTSTLPPSPRDIAIAVAVSSCARRRKSLEAEDVDFAAAAGKTLYEVLVALKEKER